MATSSKVAICAAALVELGDDPIASFDEANDRTRLAVTLYDQKRDMILRSHPWNCCKKKIILAPLADAPAFDWGAAFLLPDDCLRVLGVGQSGQSDDYEIVGRQIHMDATACYLTYIFRNEDESKWDSLLIAAMTAVMKAVCAYAITKSTTKAASDDELMRVALRVARSIDGQEEPPQTLGDSPILSARFG